MPSAPRSFYIGETVHLRVRVSEPGTRKPTDAGAVSITSLKRGATVVTPADPTFDRVREGDYALTLPTAGLAAGTYDIQVTVSDGPAAVVIIPDRFVLKAA